MSLKGYAFLHAPFDLMHPFLSSIGDLIKQDRNHGNTLQPRFKKLQLIRSFSGGLIAILSLGLLSHWASYPHILAPFGASIVLLFGVPHSPLAQPRNLVFGNTIGALVAVMCVNYFGTSPISSALAVALTITLGQICRCLHPPAGAVTLLGVSSNASPMFILSPVLSGSLVLLIIALLFNHISNKDRSYPLHWL